MNTTMTFSASGIHRGDKIDNKYGEPPSRDDWRVVSVADSTLTVRALHRWRIVERCHAWIEDHLLFPLADWRAKP